MKESTPLGTGEEIPSFVRETGLEHWNRFAAVNDEFVPIHMDDEAGRQAGYPTAFGMGNLQWAYLHNLLRQWVGEDGSIMSLSCQFRGPNLKGQTVRARGVIQAIRRDEDDSGRRLVDLEVWTEEQTGQKLAPGRATVALPVRSALIQPPLHD